MSIQSFITNSNKTALITAAIISVITIKGVLQAHKATIALIAKQEQSTDNMARWTATYKALKPTDDQWRSAFQNGSSIKDLLSLYQSINQEMVGLHSSADLLVVTKVERLTFNNLDIGLSAIEISTTGKPGFFVTADSYSALINGIQRLVGRKDIRFRGIVLIAQPDAAHPQAIIEGMAILLRDALPGE